MTLESETLFVVGESDELVCISPTQSMVISGLKSAIVGGWRVSMTNETLTILELVINDVEKFAMTRSLDPRNQFWMKFGEDRFLALRGLKSVDVNADTYNKLISIFLEFECLPVTFEQAVSISLASIQKEDRPRKSFDAHKSGRFESTPSDPTELGRRLRSQLKKTYRPIPDPNTVVGPVDAFTPSITYPPQTHITGPDGKLHSVSPVDFTTMGWEESNQVVEFPKVIITKHEE